MKTINSPFLFIGNVRDKQAPFETILFSKIMSSAKKPNLSADYSIPFLGLLDAFCLPIISLLWKRIYLSTKTYIPFGENVYTFCRKCIYLLEDCCIPFLELLNMFFSESCTDREK